MTTDVKDTSPATGSAISYSIDIVDLEKSFHRKTGSKGDYTTLKSLLLSFFRAPPEKEATLTRAVQDLTIRVPSGLSLGIIGRNGSGKSTLLKLITGIYKPTRGTVSVNGRVAALIELGAGFHPDFTGRENLVLGGVLHGLTRKEIEARFDEIVEFAELEAVIDDPVRTYSSGMFMRLGFSLAIHTDPDVLLIDEVLAVGDAAFVSKCKERISQLRRQGKTLLLVSHDLAAIERWCDEVIWLHEGKVADRGEPRRVIDSYRHFVEKGEEEELFDLAHEHDFSGGADRGEEIVRVPAEGQSEESTRWGSREVEITGVAVHGASGEEKLLFHPEDEMRIDISYALNEAVPTPVFGIGFNRSDGVEILGTNTDIERVEVPELKERGVISYCLSRVGLLTGNYSIDVAVHREDGYPYDYHKGAVQFAVRSAYEQIGVIAPQNRWEFPLDEKVVEGLKKAARAG
jgi:ABC-type polysaccharide/polyol phosphate transport system ATPase subunit